MKNKNSSTEEEFEIDKANSEGRNKFVSKRRVCIKK